MYAVYCRISVLGYSMGYDSLLMYQKDVLTKYANDLGYDDLIFIDEVKSVDPTLYLSNKLLSIIRSRSVSAIIIYDYTRIAGRYDMFIEFLMLCNSFDIKVYQYKRC